MATISSNDFKNGITIVYENQLWDIIEFQFVKPGKGTPFIRTKLKNLKTGQVLEPNFDAKQAVEQAILDKVEWEYLYRDGEHYVFMDTASFDQHHVDKKKVEPLLDFLKENTKCSAKVYDGELISIVLPDFMEFDVVECEPHIKGQQAAGGNKPAIIETGAKIMVPQFVVPGTRIKVDTRDRRYVDRV
ncbi:MAG: elongation factor P [Planctomycetes bacterium]|nr:elongation factor P [Planctomycetota bacterium]